MKMVIYMVALWLLGIAIVSSMSLYRVMHHEEVTVERSPKLYCQYGAGYGKRVWEFEPIGNNDIITDADDVFNMSMCEKWSEHGKN